MKVAVVTTEPTASRVPQFDRLSRRRDLDLHVFYAAPSIQGRTWRLELDHPHEILRGPSLPLSSLLQHDYPVTPSLWRKLDRGRFDVVVIWGWSVFASELAIAWARARRVPYVLFAESHLAERRPGWVRAVKRVVVPLAVRPAAAWLATGTLAREHLAHYGADPRRTWTFANTIDVPVYRAAAERLRARRDEIRSGLGIAEDAVVVAQVGRLLPVKGPDELVDAAAEARLHLLLVGDGPLRPALERRAADLRVDATFTGFREGEALLECYAAADVFALFSRRETWGIVVNEAMAFGLPLVLTSAVGAGADLLRPGENGELVESGDRDGQARALARLARDPELRARYGRRSLELIEPWGYDASDAAFAEAVAAARR